MVEQGAGDTTGEVGVSAALLSEPKAETGV